MKTKKYTQTGTFSILLLLPFAIVILFGLFKTGISTSPESILLQLVFLLILICLLSFYKLTIRIDDSFISFKLGIGWFGKKYRLSEIQSCQSVKNSLLYGIGIRWIFNGWLYNVSGFRAIELRFKSKKHIVRIGTDRPEEICKKLQELIG